MRLDGGDYVELFFDHRSKSLRGDRLQEDDTFKVPDLTSRHSKHFSRRIRQQESCIRELVQRFHDEISSSATSIKPQPRTPHNRLYQADSFLVKEFVIG